MSSVAVTGATGFLGLHLVRELLVRHHDLVALVRDPGALDRIARFLELVGEPPRLLDALPRRIRIVESEVSLPMLGLSRTAFHRLADEVDVVWHSAASTELHGDLESLWPINVDGTRHILELVSAGRRPPLLCHVSTAFVAGARREGVVYESELDGSAGFENAYEKTKFEAETLVRDWSRRHDRAVVVARPSVLVTDRPPHADLPPHTLLSLGQIIRDAAARLCGTSRAVVRVIGYPQGHLNFHPVERAAQTLARLTDAEHPRRMATYHVVHGHDVSVRVLMDLMETLAPLQMTMESSAHAERTALETFLDRSPTAAMLSHRRRYDDTRTVSVLGPPASPVRIDLDYLSAGIGIAPVAPRAPRLGDGN
ncbi:SDR family oxidoreductase [Nocardia sp. NPDC023852]|uniref:SDR family oxidoreductase n=1 Tax=Nocardia sp. NPDC023852 TaxID=3154697 RepID=UPI0034060B3F